MDEELELPASEKRFYTLPAGEKVIVARQCATVVNDDNVQLMQKVVDEGANAIVLVSGMDFQEARAAIIMCLASHIEDKEVNPSATLKGQPSTGKSQAEDIMLRFSNAGVLISCWEQTVAVVRDNVMVAIKEPPFYKTIALEEADQLADNQSRLSGFIAKSYSKGTSKGEVNRGQIEAGKTSARLWEGEPYDLWGVFFIVHRRTLVRSMAKLRRTIILHTYKQVKEGGFPKADAVDTPLAEHADGVNDLTLPPIYVPKGVEDGVFDNWKLYLQIAKALGLDDFIEWVTRRMVKETEAMQGDRESEIANVLYNCLIPRVPNRQKSMGGYFSIKLSEIRKDAREYHGLDITIAEMRREFTELGFKVSTPGGYPSVTPTNDTLAVAEKRLGITVEGAI